MTAKFKPMALDAGPAAQLEADNRDYFAKCREKLGFVPNVLQAYAFDNAKLRAFILMADDLMLGDSGLSKLEREMISVAVSAVNHCHYCLTSHGAAVRQRAGDPELGELMVQNYRAADLSPRQKAMLDFAVKLTEQPDKIEEVDRQRLRKGGFTDREIWDIAAVAAFYNMTNRMAAAADMRPNREYHYMVRQRADEGGQAQAQTRAQSQTKASAQTQSRGRAARATSTVAGASGRAAPGRRRGKGG